MENEIEERRICGRVKLPEAAVSYSIKRGILFKEISKGKFPVIEISRGGVRFYDQKSLKIDKEVVLQLYLPGDEIPLTLKGKVVWTSCSENADYKYQNGIQFYLFGSEKGFNPTEALDKIISLEQDNNNGGDEKEE